MCIRDRVGGEQAAHAAHGVDDLITGDGVVHPGKGHIRTGDGVHGADDVPLDAGDFHEAGHGVADEAQQVAQCHCGSGGALLGRTALEVAERSSGHRAGSAHQMCIRDRHTSFSAFAGSLPDQH